MRVSVSGGWGLLGRELTARRRPLLASLAWSTLQTTPAMFQGIFLARAIDRGFLAENIMLGFAWLAAIGAVSLVARFAQHQTFPYLADVVEPLRDNLTRLVVSSTLHHAANDDREVDLAGAARITGQVETVRNVVSALLRSVNHMGLSLVAMIAGLATLAPAILLVVIPCLLIALALFTMTVRILFARRQALILAEENVAATSNRIFAGARDIAAMRAQQHAHSEIEPTISEAAHASRALACTGLLNSLVTLVGGHAPILVVLFAAPALTGEHHLEAGAVLGVVTYLRIQLIGGLGSLMSLISGWGLQLGATLQRINDVCQQPRVTVNRGLQRPVGYQLRVRNLTFAHSHTTMPVLEHFDLTVDEDEHLAILGSSGIGKSTLANLLCGLLKGQDGRIEFGMIPLHEIAADRLRSLVALIPQESYIFDGTLRENLTYLAPYATDSDIDKTVDALNMKALVQRLGGYETRFTIGDIGLSQGERQLIALARVHVSPASVVVLDEATCHLDPNAEATVEDAFAKRPGTVIVIAHRISSALRARRILLLGATHVIHGTHDELLKASAHYAELVARWG
ncbi:ABC transporter ATP-binding protein [Streptomyces wedmorensis]